MDSSNPYMLECLGICKSFAKNIVLRNVDFRVTRGKVHALLGANGAGKSTLVKIITGVYSCDSGSILLNGEQVSFSNALEAEKRGVSIIHQDPQLVPNFTVYQNAFLGTERRKRTGLLDKKSMRTQTKQALELMEADFSTDDLIKNLSLGQREQVAIAAALITSPQVLVLDEPTASLSDKEINRLFDIIRNLRDQGITIIYISHHLDEIFEIADDLTVLRDGEAVISCAVCDITKEEIIKQMMGHDISQLYPKRKIPIGEDMLRVEDLAYRPDMPGVSFHAKRGEIVGFAGLVGTGRTETMLALYGAEKAYGGTVYLDGKRFKPRSPLQSRKKGIAFIPEDRRREGLCSTMNIRENISLTNMAQWATAGLIRRKEEKRITQEACQSLSVISAGTEQIVSELSGGNQQKVVIARWLMGTAKVCIFDQPTTGVDVNAKIGIYNQMMHFAEQGAAVLFISSEFEELLGMCDRIYVMAKGQIRKEFKAGHVTGQDLLYYATNLGDTMQENDREV